jgi:activator of HSP90 ATPase
MSFLRLCRLDRMTTTIRQTVRFPASASALYEAFLSPKAHAAFTGAPARISDKPRAKFRVVDYASGENLSLTKGRQIIQTWRADDWDEDAPDSVLILNFGDDGTLEMVHAGVPDDQKAALADGWRQYYWKPLRAYLKRAQAR